MSYSLLISDLHLDPERPAHLAELERLLADPAVRTVEMGPPLCRSRWWRHRLWAT